MDSQKRLLLALALSVGLTTLFLMFNPPSPAPPAPAVTEGADAGTTPAPAAAATPKTESDAPSAPTAGAGLSPPAEVKQIARDEMDVTYVASSRGAGLVAARFKGSKMREQRPLSMLEGYKLLFGGNVSDAAQIDMAAPAAMFPASLAVSVRGEMPLDPWTTWTVEEGEAGDRVVFLTRQGVWEIRKTLEWPDSNEPSRPAGRGYEMAITLTIANLSSRPASGELAVHYSRGVDPRTEEKPSLLGAVGNESKATCFVRDEMLQIVPGQSIPKPEELRGPISFIGVDQQYFLGAVFPVGAAREGRCEMYAAPEGRAAVALFPISVPPGGSVTEKFGVYVGPKDSQFLEIEPTPEMFATLGIPPAAHNARLNATVNFGIWEVICVILLAILKFFHGLFGNWGVAIILLTLTVKIVLLPLSFKSMVAAENMKKLQPRMEAIRKKFEGDRERMNMELMKLYQEAKVNPLGGCFPLLIQMPVWIALFTTLRNSYEIYREPFFGPVWTDLTYKDPTYILPVLLGVTMIITQRLQPAMMDKAQQRLMTWFMPIFFTIIMLAYPAGLTLYIFTNNLLSIGQQYGLRKYLEKRGGTPSKAVAKRPA